MEIRRQSPNPWAFCKWGSDASWYFLRLTRMVFVVAKAGKPEKLRENRESRRSE
jgi:hypothetical protein